jgi:hypothetical protein
VNRGRKKEERGKKKKKKRKKRKEKRLKITLDHAAAHVAGQPFGAAQTHPKPHQRGAGDGKGQVPHL